MGNAESTETVPVAEHIDTVARWMRSRKLVINEETGDVSGLLENDETELREALQQATLAANTGRTLVLIRGLLKNDKDFIFEETSVHYITALHRCLHYVDVEIQISAAIFVAALCDPANTEPATPVISASHNANLREGTVPEVQDLRMRLGSFGFVYPAVLLSFQPREDLQLLGLEIIAGLALHPLNRILVAKKMGLQPLVIHLLSTNRDIRIMASVTMARLVAQPKNYEDVDHNKHLEVSGTYKKFPVPDFITLLPREIVPVVHIIFEQYLADHDDPDTAGPQATVERDDPATATVKDRLVNQNAVYLTKQGCITSLLTLLLRSIATERGAESGGKHSTAALDQNAVMACGALYVLVQMARQSAVAREAIASERVILHLSVDRSQTGQSDNISARGLDVILYLTTRAVRVELRRPATELIVELTREEENIVLFRSPVDLTPDFMDSMKRANTAALAGERREEGTAIHEEFGSDITAVYLLYLASLDDDEIVRAFATIAFLELSIDNLTMNDIIRYRAIQPVLNIAVSPAANSVIKRRCAWALCSIGTHYSGMPEADVLNVSHFTDAMAVLITLLETCEDAVTRRESSRALASFALRELGADFMACHPTAVNTLIGIVDEALVAPSMLADSMFMAVRTLANLCMYRKHYAALLGVAKKRGHPSMESFFGRLIEEHWDVSQDIAYVVVRTREMANAADGGGEASGNYEFDADAIAERAKEWHVKHRSKAALIPEEIQAECVLAIGCVMRADHLAIFKHRWVDLFTHWAKSEDLHVTSKALAALANVGQCGLSHLRLIEHTDDYCELSLLESLRSQADRSRYELRGLDTLPMLAELVRAKMETYAPRREAATVLARFSRSPNGLLCWLQLNPEDPMMLTADFSGNAMTFLKGRPTAGGLSGGEEDLVDDVDDPESDYGRFLMHNLSNQNRASADCQWGVYFQKGDVVVVNEIDSCIEKLCQSAGSSEGMSENRPETAPTASRLTGPRFPPAKVGLKPEWTISVWVFLEERASNFTPGSLATLTGTAATEDGTYATVCQSSAGDHYIAVKVVTERIEEVVIGQAKGRPVDGLSSSNRQKLRFEDGVEEGWDGKVAFVTHRLGAYDATTKQWLLTDFDLQSLPNGWRHIVALCAGEFVFFYVDTYFVGRVEQFKGGSDISYVGNDSSLTHPVGYISDFRVFGYMIPEKLLTGSRAGRHPFNASRPNAKNSLYLDPIKEREQFQNSTGNRQGRRHLFFNVDLIPSQHSRLSALSLEETWVDLPPDYVATYMGQSSLGIIAALVGALDTDASEVLRSCTRALGNIALVGSNRPKIIAAGAMMSLVRLSNHLDPRVALEASRAILHLR